MDSVVVCFFYHLLGPSNQHVSSFSSLSVMITDFQATRAIITGFIQLELTRRETIS